MQRLIDAHGHDEEFSQAKLIDDDTAMKLELQQKKVRRLTRRIADPNCQLFPLHSTHFLVCESCYLLAGQVTVTQRYMCTQASPPELIPRHMIYRISLDVHNQPKIQDSMKRHPQDLSSTYEQWIAISCPCPTTSS
jgi:hypothetical protein